MATYSSIEWTEQTWNPITGCTKISPRCKNSYAATLARRLQAMNVPGYENGFALSLMPQRLAEPLKRRKPTLYFVNSMSDLFQDGVPDEFINSVFDIMKRTPQHTYQVLTKRASRVPKFFDGYDVPDNAWLGVSVEDKKYGFPRIEELRKARVHTRFLSVEPLLEDLGDVDRTGIHWMIVGGESGPKARPMKKKWVINLQRQCAQQDVAFFFKQWGSWGADGKKRTKKRNGRLLMGKTWNAMPARPWRAAQAREACGVD